METIYLDNAATTKPNVDFLKVCYDFAVENYYNPSALYRQGRLVRQEVENARKDILSIFPKFDIVFTSCGTESDNTAIMGFFKRGNAITTQGEHSAVYQCFESLRAKGSAVKYAKLNKDGSVNVEDLLSLIDEKTTFISVVHVNNETGAINDINYIAKKAKEIAPRLVFHSDGVQAFGKIPFVPNEYIDLYSVSAHKIGGIKGVGALLYKNTLKIPPYIIGGGQENGIRSGTENVLGILQFSKCAKFAYDNLQQNFKRAESLKKVLLNGLDTSRVKVISSDNSSPYVVNFTCEGLRGEVLQHMLEDEGILVGTGSACSSKHPHSRVLKACGYVPKQLDGVIRVSFGFNTTIEEVECATEKINACIDRLFKVVNKL